MVNHNNDLDEYRRILKTVEDALEQGPWRESRFLMAIGKKLLQIRQKLKNTIEYQELLEANARPKEQVTTRVMPLSDQLKVFISLYSSEGRNLDAWQKQLSNLRSLLISRPIYSKEEDVRQWIRSRPNDELEAYASIYIHSKDIIPAVTGRATTDKLGNPLIQTKGSFMQAPTVDQFFHRSGVYDFQDGKLARVSDFSVE